MHDNSTWLAGTNNRAPSHASAQPDVPAHHAPAHHAPRIDILIVPAASAYQHSSAAHRLRVSFLMVESTPLTSMARFLKPKYIAVQTTAMLTISGSLSIRVTREEKIPCTMKFSVSVTINGWVRPRPCARGVR